MSLGSTFSGMGKSSSMDLASGFYPVGGAAAAAGLEQWRAQQMQGFPFFHALADHQQHTMAPAAATAMAMPGMLHYLGLDSGRHGNGEDDGGDHQFRATMASKREGYPRSGSIGMYAGGDHHLTAGYTSSYSNTATGNHLL
jgi:hypothetical protein